MTTVNATTVTTVETTHHQPVQKSRKNKHTNLPPQQQLTSEKSHQTATKMALGTQIEPKELVSLKERASCLSQETDLVFKTTIKNAIFFLNGFVGTLKGDNLDYKSDETNGLSETVKRHYKDIKERDHKHYIETASRTDDLKIAIQTRIIALEQAALKAQFEAELLTQACVGKESNFATNFLARDYKYGIPYRLSEASHALDTRNKKLHIQGTDTQEDKTEALSDELQGLNTLLANAIALKEVVTVYSEVFKNEQFASLKKCIYFEHLNFLKDFEKKFEEKKESIAQRLAHLNTCIERESLNEGSSLLPSLKFEKLAIEDSVTRMKLRLKEIAKFLGSYKVDENEKPSEITMEVLSEDHERALTLLKRIVSFKENLLRDNMAEAELSIDQRKNLYLEAFKNLAQITTAATEVKKSYEKRVKELDTQARGCLTSIEKLKSGIVQLQEALNKTVEASRERLQWKLETDVKHEEVKKSDIQNIQQETPSSSFLSYFTSWRRSSSQGVSPVITPSSPLTNASSSLPVNGDTTGDKV